MRTHETEFIRLIEAHERAWGDEIYRGRPSLEQIMNTQVVVFWRSHKRREERYTISVYATLDDVEAYLTKLLFRAAINPPAQILSRIYASKRRMHITGVTINFGVSEGAK